MKKENLYSVSGIYIIICLITLKFYIGCSNQVGRRLNEHKTDLKNNYHDNSYLQNAYNKYGKDNFLFLLFERFPEEGLDDREIGWIKELKSQNKNIGYNITAGGESGRRGLKHTEESKLKMSIKRKESYQNEGHELRRQISRENIEKANTPENNKKHSIRMKQRNYITAKTYIFVDKNNNKYEVNNLNKFCIDFNLSLKTMQTLISDYYQRNFPDRSQNGWKMISKTKQKPINILDYKNNPYNLI